MPPAGEREMEDHGDPLSRLSKEEIRDLVGKGWLTHDGMWFVQAAAELGIEQANSLNQAAIRSMAEIEVSRLTAALGVDPDDVTSSGEVCRLLTDGFTLLLPESVAGRISVSAPDPATVRIEWDEGECFAYKGMQRAGLLDGYECGVVYRIECWLKALGVRLVTDPPPGRCLMRIDGRCTTELRLRPEP
jgi:hypothetical protein